MDVKIQMAITEELQKNKSGDHMEKEYVDKLTLWKSILGSVPGGDHIDVRKIKNERCFY